MNLNLNRKHSRYSILGYLCTGQACLYLYKGKAIQKGYTNLKSYTKSLIILICNQLYQ